MKMDAIYQGCKNHRGKDKFDSSCTACWDAVAKQQIAEENNDHAEQEFLGDTVDQEVDQEVEA
jgi:hypothetical protein